MNTQQLIDLKKKEIIDLIKSRKDITQQLNQLSSLADKLQRELRK